MTFDPKARFLSLSWLVLVSLLSYVFIPSYAYNAAGDFVLAKRLGGTGTDLSFDITSDSNNRIIVTGFVSGDADLNGDGDNTDGGAESSSGYGASDIFISVFNSAGTFQWAKRLGGTSNDQAEDVIVDSNNRIIVVGRVIGDADLNGDGDNTDGGAESSSGYSGTDIVFSVFDSAGNFQFAKRLGGTGGSDIGYSGAVDSNDRIIIGGQVEGDGDMNGDGDSTDGGAESSSGYGSTDAFFSVFDSSGIFQWAKRLGGTTVDTGYSVTIDSNNRIVFVGRTWNNADMNGDGDSSDGGAESSSGYGNYDIFLSVFDSTGTFQFAKRLGGTGSDIGNDVAVDSNNRIAITGYVSGNADANGDGDSTDGGAESSSGYGSIDGLVSVFNSSGVFQFAKRLGGIDSDSINSVNTDASNRIILSGSVVGNADLNGDGDGSDGGAESGSGYGNYDAFISIFDSSGNFEFAKRLGGSDIDSSHSIRVDGNNQIILSGSVIGNADMNADGDNTDGGAENASGYGGYDAFFSVFEGFPVPSPSGYFFFMP